MSDCIIKLKIGDQEIILDPGAHITADDYMPLAKTIPADKLRSLYGQLKEHLTLGAILTNHQEDFITAGKSHYDELVKDATGDKFVTLLGAISKEKDPERLKALTAYAASLDAREILDHGNFMIDPSLTYKASPYSHEQIRKIVFKNDGDKVKLFDQLRSLPGMESLKMSIAYASKWNGKTIDKAKGAYITPDNIVQVVLPSKKKGYHIIGSDPHESPTEKNVGQEGKGQVQDVFIHELMHAVYSEQYNNDPVFRQKIDAIHQALLEDFTKKGKTQLAERYKDPHEFIASAFEDNNLQNALAKVPVNSDVDISDSLFDVFKGVLDDKVEKPNLLRDFVSTIGTNLPIIGPEESWDLRVIHDSVLDRANVFYLDGISDADIEENMSPRDQADGYYGNNRKAFYANKRFQTKWHEDSFIRDSYYKGTIQNPTSAQVDRLYKDDVVLLPWLRYVKASPGKPGRWQEVGVLVNAKGESIKKNGKDQIVPIVRDEKGNVKKNEDGSTVKEMTQGFPVMYSSTKKKQVVVAKTNLTTADEFNTPSGKKFNTVSFPYNLIKGIRKLDYSYFNHNDDYEGQLKEAQSELTKIQEARKEGDKKYEDQTFFEERVEQLNKSVQKAKDIKDEIKYYYKTYAFSHEENGIKYMNVSKLDYVKAGYKSDDMDKRQFSDQPIFLVKGSDYKTKDGKDKFFSYPNPKLFDLFWNDDSGKEFAKSSEQIADAVGTGDLVRLKSTNEFKMASGEKVKVRMKEWMTVYKRVGNGILVCTQEGHGYVVPFNMIEGYAKNKTTPEYKNMLLQYEQQMLDFNKDAFETKTYDNGKTGRGFTKEINHRALIYNEKYNKKDDETEEESLKRFDGNLQRIKAIIKPNDSFVRLNKRFTNDSGQRVDYQANGLVLAKTDEGLVVFTETRGYHNIEHIRFDQRLNSGDKSGSEMTYFMENMANVKKTWEEYDAEKKSYAKNRESANFKAEGTAWTMLQDPKLNPHGFKDVYDFYDKIDGNTLHRLGISGGIIDIKSDKFNLKDKQGNRVPIFRKVMRVLDDGTVVVAEKVEKDVKMKSGYLLRAGKLYARYVKPENIARIGLNLGEVTKDETTQELHSSQNEDLLSRRKSLWERSKSDRDFNNFTFAKDMNSVRALNSKVPLKDKDSWRYVPLTNKILEPQSKADKEAGKVDDRPIQYLDRDFNVVDKDKSAYVIATFKKNSDELKYVNRGILVKTSLVYKEAATYKDKDGNTKFKQKLLDALYPGDWVTTTSKDGSLWDAVIERVEGGNIYTLNTDLTTSKVSIGRLYGIKLSQRNDKYSNFKRSKTLISDLLKSRQSVDAKESKDVAKPKEIKKPEETDDNDLDAPPFSLEAAYKSPKSSRRALYSIGNRLKEINPEVRLNYVDSEEIATLAKSTNHDYNDARAFVLKGEVYVNLDKASISDVVHEYAHLFLHSLKYENPKLYETVISVTNNHSLYNHIANDYLHLEGSDLNEEVFVTVLGEYMKNRLLPVDQQNMDQNQSVILDFAEYTKSLLNKAMNKQGDSVYDIDPKQILNMSLEDVMNLIGDHVMNNKITDPNKGYRFNDIKDIGSIIKEMTKLGYLTRQC